MLGNGHGSGPSLVELGMALEGPASAASTTSGQKAAAGVAGLGSQTGTQKSPKSAGRCPSVLRACYFEIHSQVVESCPIMCMGTHTKTLNGVHCCSIDECMFAMVLGGLFDTLGRALTMFPAAGPLLAPA